MITAAQMRAARALLGIDQRELAQRSGLSLPTIQRMEASDGVVRGNVDFADEAGRALAANGIELIGEGAASAAAAAGCGSNERPRGGDRYPRKAETLMAIYALYGVAALLALAPIAVALGASPRASNVIYGACLVITLALCTIGIICLFGRATFARDIAARPALARRAFPHRCARGVLPGGGQSRRRGGEPVRARLWPARGGAAARAAVLSRFSRRHEPCRARRRCLQLPGVVGVHVAHLVGAGDRASSRRARICAPATSIC